MKRKDWKMATNTSPTQPMHCNANSNNISYSNGTISNGTGLTTSNLVNYYTTAATTTTGSNTAFDVFTSYMKPKSFKLGNTVVCIYNCYNKYFMVDNVQFSFETEGTNVKLRVANYGTTNLYSLDEVRNYIKTLKMYYLKCKEFEKQLKLTSDFQ